MDISSFAAPPPGSAAPGNLYADLQTRTLWLGVDLSVDPAGAVLVSDIVAMMDQIDEVLLDAKAYTDTQVLTRAPTVHTHTAGQITDFNSAVTSVVLGIPGANWVSGMILMWSGSMAAIGSGDLAGWALCDGANGTPDLRDRMIIGAGNKVPGTKNSQASLTTDLAGAFTPVIQAMALSLSQIPSHAHTQQGTFNTGYVSSDHTHAISFWSGWAGSHQHPNGYAGTNVPDEGGWSYKAAGSDASSYTGAAGDHQHAINGNTGGISANHYHAVTIGGATAAAGSGGTHTHTANAVPGHGHVISSNTLRETMPYYALAFIMKL